MSKEVKSKEPAIEAEPKEKATKEPVNQKTAEAKKIYVGATVPAHLLRCCVSMDSWYV